MTVEMIAVPTVRHCVNDLITDLRGVQNEMLARHEYREASDVQRVILAALDVIHVHGMIQPTELWRLKNIAVDSFLTMARRRELNGRPEMAVTLIAFATEYRVESPEVETD